MHEELWPGERPHLEGMLPVWETWTNVCQPLSILKLTPISFYPHERGSKGWKERKIEPSLLLPTFSDKEAISVAWHSRRWEKGRMAPITHKMGPILYRRGHYWVRRHRSLYATCCRWATSPFLACLEQLSSAKPRGEYPNSIPSPNHSLYPFPTERSHLCLGEFLYMCSPAPGMEPVQRRRLEFIVQNQMPSYILPSYLGC